LGKGKRIKKSDAIPEDDDIDYKIAMKRIKQIDKKSIIMGDESEID